MLTFSLYNERILFHSDGGQYLGAMSALLIRPGNDNYWNPFPMIPSLCGEGDSVTALCWSSKSGSVSLRLVFQQTDTGLCGTLTASGSGHAMTRLIWELPPDEYFPFMPAFMYGTNQGGGSPWSTYPRLSRTQEELSFSKPWIAEEWLARTDRSSHGFASLIGRTNTFAIGGSDVCRYGDGAVAEKTGLGISMKRLFFSLGYANDPYTYSVIPGRNAVSRTEGTVDLGRGPVTTPLFLRIMEGGAVTSRAPQLMRLYYASLHEASLDSRPVEITEAITNIANAVCRYAYDSEARNFYVTLPDTAASPDAGPFVPAFNTGWAGGMRTAYPLLAAGYLHNNRGWIDCAASVIDNIAQNAISPRSDLFFENYDPIKKQWNSRGWWYRDLESPGHSGYVNGQACYNMLAAYLGAAEHGEARPHWLQSAQRVLNHVVATQQPSGSFGYIYSEEDGRVLDPDGFSGCWFAPALVLLFSVTGDGQYLSAAKKAVAHYSGFVEEYTVYGGPHDIFKSPDEEGIIAYIKACELLHRVTGNSRYLGRMLDGVEYEFSWKFSYNPVMEVEPLKSMNWRCCGGSVTSVNNAHIHPMGSSLLANLRYISEQTGDPYVEQRLCDTLRWTLRCYLHEDGEYGWGKKGLINERFCYTDSLLAERFPDGSPASTWFCAHSWASGAVLEGLTEYQEIYERKGSL